MLILTRKPGQGFLVGDDIMITITELQGDKVRIGIDAPKHIKVLRSELSETMEQNLQAAERPDAGALKALAQKRGKQGTGVALAGTASQTPRPASAAQLSSRAVKPENKAGQ